MASVQRDKKTGRALIQFIGPDGKRHKLRLGKMSERNAERFNEKLEELITAAKHAQPIDAEVLAWTKKLSDDVAAKLTAYGLLSKRESVSLGKLIDDYLANRGDVKPQTITTLRQTQRNLVTFFGYDRSMREITEGDADEFRSHLLRPKAPKVDGNRAAGGGEGLSMATARRRCSAAKQFFRVAMRKNLIVKNPFADHTGGSKSNKDRMYFVTREEAAAVLAECPDNEARLIFALSRFGGLRTPSEHFGLRWEDVDLPNRVFLVHSPKTEHHEGGESREVPMFEDAPELLEYFEAAWDAAPPMPAAPSKSASPTEAAAIDAERNAASFVIQRYRNGPALRSMFQKIIKRAGLKQWPKIFQNLRSTRQTELAKIHPMYLVCAWIGNSEKIAQESYLQVRKEDHRKAAGLPVTAPTVSPKSVSIGGAELAHSGAISSAQARSQLGGESRYEYAGTLLTAPDSAGEIGEEVPPGLFCRRRFR